MVILDQDTDLVADGGAIKAHEKQLAQLAGLYTGQRGAQWSSCDRENVPRFIPDGLAICGHGGERAPNHDWWAPR